MPKRPYYLVKKVISCNRSVHSSRLRISDFYAKLVKRLNQRSQQDGFLSSRAMLSQPYIVSTVFFFLGKLVKQVARKHEASPERQ